MQKPEYVRTRRRMTPLFGASLLACGINILVSAVGGDWTEVVGWACTAGFNTLWAMEK